MGAVPMSTVYHLFAQAAATFDRHTAVELMRRHTIDAVSYADLQALVDRAAVALHALGIQAGDRCAILADNDADWCAAYLGTLRLGATAVPLDTGYSAGQVGTVVADCGVAAVFTSARYLPVAREALATAAEPPPLVLVRGEAPGAVSLTSADPRGAALLPPCPATASDIAVILYTSGTTSDPKGVMLSHGNMLAERDAAFSIVSITETDAILGVLPLFHALAQIANLLIPLTVGARIVFMETVSSSEMVRVLAERGITAFCVVPQFFYLIHQRVMERIAEAPWPARATFRLLLRLNGAARQWLGVNLGRFLFGRVHAAVGRTMRILVTGGSRFDPRIGRDLFRMGFNIIQAYGLTECAGACTATRPGDPHIESVGQPFAGVDVRVKDEPSDGRPRDYPDGEVLVRGPIVMTGYFNRPDATAATLQDGWLHTGDLGYLDDAGRLHITGRKKEMIVLASGKNIYPEEIEAVYLRSPFIKELCVLGVSRPDEPAAERLHAVVVPNLEAMRERRVVNMREVIRFDIEGLSLQLPHHKRVLSFDVWQDDLPRTTTRKLKRHAIEQAYYERAAASAGTGTATPLSEQDQVWMTDPFVERALRLVRAAAKPGAEVTPGASLELDLGLDSMERVELVTALEQACAVDVPDDEVHRLFTVRDLVDAIRTSAAGAAVTAPDVDPWGRLLAADADTADLAFLLRPRPFYTPIAFTIVRTYTILATLCWGLRVSGTSHVAASGAFLISPNHQSFLDAFLLVGTLPYRTFSRVFFVGAAEYFDTPLRRGFARLINLVPVDPDAHLVHAMQAGAFGLRHGKVLVLFPEGERSPDGSVRTFKKGAAILATHLNVPIVPAALHGIYEIWPRGSGMRWASMLPFSGVRARLAYGSPVRPDPREASALPAGDGYSRLTATLRDAVLALWNRLDRDAHA